MSILNLKDVCVAAGENQILADINFEINAGERHLVVGKTDQEKTALFHSIGGHPDLDIIQGTAKFMNRNLLKMSPIEKFRKGIGIIFKYPKFNQELTILEFAQLMFGQKYTNDTLKKLIQKYSSFFEIEYEPYYTTHTLKELSLVEQKIFDIVFVMIAQPKLIICDYIDIYFDSNDLSKVSAGFNRYFKENPDKACLFTTMNKNFADQMAPTHVHLIEDGIMKFVPDYCDSKRSE